MRVSYFAQVVLPALLRWDGENNVLAVVLGGLGSRVLSEATDEDDFNEHGVMGSVLSGVSAACGTCLPKGVARHFLAKATGLDLAEEDPKLM